MSAELTQDRLKELFCYDPTTGDFIRRFDSKNGLKGNSVAGCLMKVRGEYLCIKIDRRLYLCHRLAWLYMYGVFPSDVIDHINEIGTDNRLVNLRVVTNEQNIQRTLRPPAHNTSGFRGVSWSKYRGAWVAGISIKNKRRFIGYFDSPIDAHQAYLETKKRVHFA